MESVLAGMVSAVVILLLERLLDMLRDKRKRKEMLDDKSADKKQAEESATLAEIKSVGKRVEQVELDIAGLRDEVKEVREEVQESRVVESRYRILRFADEITHGTAHSKDHFEQIMADINQYEAWCGTHPRFKNGVTRTSAVLIEETYQERLRKNDFL